VEDEEDIIELVVYNLSKEGYQVQSATSGEKALEIVRAKLPDLVLLDLMLPGVDGLEVCKTLKNYPNTAHIPIIMLTARGEEADIVTGLELGADDYIVKPFSLRVLSARVKAVLRRKDKEPIEGTEIIRIKNMMIHPGRHEVTIAGKEIDLTLSEFRLLRFLASRPGWVFTRDQIINEIRGEDYAVTERSVDVQVVGLRKKLKDYGKLIETVRGVGYRFKE
jgi:two-component system phosphate regulon response regulator PhoB